MKFKIKIVAAVVATSMLMPALALADTHSTSTASSTKENIRERLDEIKNKAHDERESIKGEVEAKREGVKSELEQRKDDLKAKSEASIKARLSRFMNTLEERFDAAVDRLYKISDRIDSRIAKMKAEGIDTSKAEGLLATAKLKIDIAASSTDAIKANADALIGGTATGTDLRVQYDAVKALVEAAKTNIKAAHAALIEVVANLKPGFNKERHATSTSATTTATTTP